jgi:hypothetical protein
MVPYKEVYLDIQKAKHSEITSFFTKSFCSPSAMHSAWFDQSHSFQPGMPTSSQETPSLMFSFLLIVNYTCNVHNLIVFHMSSVPQTPFFP